MTNANKAVIAVVLDRSGSMMSCARDMEGGFDTYIKAQQELPGECRVTLNQFNTRFENVYQLLPVHSVPPLQLLASGGTALLDAIARTITELGAELARLEEADRPGSVEVVIITDGEENSSEEFSLETGGQERVRTMIKTQQEVYSWKFTYLGANQDAVMVARNYGIPQASSITYDTDNAVGTFVVASASSAAYRGSVAAGASYSESLAASDFSDEDREVVMTKPKKRTTPLP